MTCGEPDSVAEYSVRGMFVICVSDINYSYLYLVNPIETGRRFNLQHKTQWVESRNFCFYQHYYISLFLYNNLCVLKTCYQSLPPLP